MGRFTGTEQWHKERLLRNKEEAAEKEWRAREQERERERGEQFGKRIVKAIFRKVEEVQR